jgi:uncharacterized membrane protein YjfL (UPF0719 family)
MDVYFSIGALVNSLVFMALGLLIFSVLLRPLVAAQVKAFRKEIIEEKNTALAILVGFLSLSISIIVAAAVH